MLVKVDGEIDILTAYPFILDGTQDSLVGRWTNFGKGDIETTYFSKSRNCERVNIIHPIKWSILIGLISTLLIFLAHNALTFQIQGSKNAKEEDDF